MSQLKRMIIQFLTSYKQAAKEIAFQNDCAITFMAKWDQRYAGSSMHLHVSLVDKDGKPCFPGDEGEGKFKSSPHFRWFLEGWIARVWEIFPFYAPYPTSYKRYVEGSFAPTRIA